ncbi:hypothetical protein D1872_208950 [compost metagenome]
MDVQSFGSFLVLPCSQAAQSPMHTVPALHHDVTLPHRFVDLLLYKLRHVPPAPSHTPTRTIRYPESAASARYLSFQSGYGVLNGVRSIDGILLPSASHPAGRLPGT